jgi:hypothetical protein
MFAWIGGRFCGLVAALCLALSGCSTFKGSHDTFAAPELPPGLELGRVILASDLGDQLIAEVFILNSGRTPLAVDTDRFYLEVASVGTRYADGYVSYGHVIGRFDSLGGTCIITVPPVSTNRIWLATAYMGGYEGSVTKGDFEIRWNKRIASVSDVRLAYVVPTLRRCDWLWMTPAETFNKCVEITADRREVWIQARQGRRGPSWEEWSPGRRYPWIADLLRADYR